jgi:hypothetical protein
MASGGGAGKVPEMSFSLQYSRRTMPWSWLQERSNLPARPVGQAIIEQNMLPDLCSERASYMSRKFQHCLYFLTHNDWQDQIHSDFAIGWANQATSSHTHGYKT